MILFIISILIIGLTATCLIKKFNPQGILMTAGLIMCIIALLLGGQAIALDHPTGSVAFDLIKFIEQTFISNIGRAGLMIMTIGGYVALMNHIEATHTLVRISMEPLKCLKRFPMLAAVLTIPVGQLLFITTPSASGLGLLLVASVYPILINLGVSRLTALSMISATTIFDQGPGSANTALAAELIGENNVGYFIIHQLPLVIPTTLFVMAIFYIFNTYFDRQDYKKGIADNLKEVDGIKLTAPFYFAFFPIMPLALLVVLSPYTALTPTPIGINTTTAMLFSLFATLIIYLVHTRDIKETFKAFSAFWHGMGKVFGNVVTLIVASEVFSKGLIQMKFIENLINISTNAGLTGMAIVLVFTVIIFCAAILMGSGNAAFFSFGPLMPGIAKHIGLPAYALVLPTQLSSSMGRAASPIAGVIVAIAGVAGASPMNLARRNVIPLTISVIFMMTYHLIIY